MTHPTTEQTGLTRRDILKRGAAFGGALMWATPVVQVMGMSPAHARPVSPGCIRYCIKWETDGNQRLLDTQTGDYQLTCEEGGGHVLWTSFWVGLGGKNADEADTTAEAATVTTTAEQPLESTTTSSTTTTTTTEGLNDSAEGEEVGEDPSDAEGGENGESGTEGALSGAAEATESSSAPAASETNDVTQSQNNGRNGPPEGNPGGPPESNSGGPPEGNPGGPPADDQGNCIECDTRSSVNSDAAAQQLAEDMGIEVYGDSITGFYVSIPSDCSLADLDEEGLDAAAVKVGGQGGGVCSVVVDEVDDPCRPGYTRIVLPNPNMAQDISHIELIIDCCE